MVGYEYARLDSEAAAQIHSIAKYLVVSRSAPLSLSLRYRTEVIP